MENELEGLIESIIAAQNKTNEDLQKVIDLSSPIDRATLAAIEKNQRETDALLDLVYREQDPE